MVTQGFGNGFNIAGSPINPIQAVAPGDIWRRMVASSPWGMNPLARGAAEAQRPMLETQYALQQPGINMPDEMLGMNPYRQFLKGNLYGTDFDPAGKTTGRFTGQLRGDQLMNRLRQIADITSPAEGGGPYQANTAMEMALQQTFENPEAQLQAAQLPALMQAAPAARGSIQRGYQRLFDQFMGRDPTGNFLAASLDPASDVYQPMVGGDLSSIPTYTATETPAPNPNITNLKANNNDAPVVVGENNQPIKSSIVTSVTGMNKTTTEIGEARLNNTDVTNGFSAFIDNMDTSGDTGSRYLTKASKEVYAAAQGISTIGNQYVTVDPGFMSPEHTSTFSTIDRDVAAGRMPPDEAEQMKRSIYDSTLPKTMEWVPAPGGISNGYVRVEDWFTMLGLQGRGLKAQEQFMSEIPVLYPSEFALIASKQGSNSGTVPRQAGHNYIGGSMGSFALKTSWLPDRLRAFKGKASPWTPGGGPYG